MPETVLVSSLMALLAAVVSAIMAAAPAMGPRDRFFGVIVEPGFESGAFARRTVRAYRWMFLGIGVAFVSAFLLPLLGSAPIDLITPVALLFTVALVAPYVWAHRRTLRQVKPTPAGEAAAADSRHWKLGIVYFNPSDPRVDVPKNFGVGSTLNFARGTSWLVISIPLFFAGLILLVVALVT